MLSQCQAVELAATLLRDREHRAIRMMNDDEVVVFEEVQEQRRTILALDPKNLE